jgi:hypothetical protein
MVEISASGLGFEISLGGGRGFLVSDFAGYLDLLEPEPQLVAEGALRRSLDLELPANALVDRLEVVVTAKPAIATLAVDVAQVRLGATGTDLVIDFGAPRTVSVVRPAGGFSIGEVRSWNGMAFAAISPAAHMTLGGTAVLPEVRTERLQLVLGGSGDKAVLIAQTMLVLPDAPSDLELRIDDGPPAWRQAGAIRLEPRASLTANGFNQDGQRLVDLTAALAALTGDPTSTETRRFRLELTSRTAGRLDLAAPVERRTLRRIWRANADGEAEARLAFAEEGTRALALSAPAMPAEAAIAELRVTLKGTPPPDRVVPPVGPPPSDLAELALDADRAAIVRLPAASGLAGLTALRLPLAVADGGAEAAVALWSGTDTGQPDAPLPKGASKPVALDAGAERWVTFPFAGPVPLEDTGAGSPPTTLWAALLVSRGRIVWRPTSRDAAAADPAAGVLRTGPQAGPWYALPALFDPLPGNPFGQLRGRVRLAGKASPTAPIAAVQLCIGAVPADTLPPSVAATPSDAGTRVTVAPGAAGRTLTVIAGAAMTFTLSDIDLVTTG